MVVDLDLHGDSVRGPPAVGDPQGWKPIPECHCHLCRASGVVEHPESNLAQWPSFRFLDHFGVETHTGGERRDVIAGGATGGFGECKGREGSSARGIGQGLGGVARFAREAGDATEDVRSTGTDDSERGTRSDYGVGDLMDNTVTSHSHDHIEAVGGCRRRIGTCPCRTVGPDCRHVECPLEDLGHVSVERRGETGCRRIGDEQEATHVPSVPAIGDIGTLVA